MSKLRLLFPALSLGLFLGIATDFVLRHGGWHGDVKSRAIGTDVLSEPEDRGQILFNRWVFVPHREPFHVRSFMYLNLPAFVISKAVMSFLGIVMEEFVTAYPLGLSYATYSVTLAVVLSLVQWFAIGALIDRFGQRARRATVQ
jgi:hypothetical protein